MKITKLQLDTITSTLNQRAQNHFRAKSNTIVSKLKPSAEAEKLANELKAVLTKVNNFNNKVKASNKIGHVIEHNSYNDKVETKLYGYTSVYFPTLGSITLVPEIAQEAQNVADDVSNYILKLTLGQETIEGMESFLANLLK